MYVFVSLSGEENVCRYGNRFGWLLIFDDCVTRDQTTGHGKGESVEQGSEEKLRVCHEVIVHGLKHRKVKKEKNRTSKA